MNTAHHITVKFEGDGVPMADRGRFLLALEKWARAYTGKPIEVFLERLKDDSNIRNNMAEKRRRDMTDEERAAL